MTFVPPIELLTLNYRVFKFRRLSTQILPISVASSFSNLYYLLLKQNQGDLDQLDYLLVSHLNQTISTKYQLLTNDELSLPRLFIIDKERIIQYCMFNNLLCSRSVDELLRILKSIHI